MMQRSRIHAAEWIWILPAGALLLLIVGYPLVRTLVQSLFHDSLTTAFQSRFAGLSNFARLLFDSRLRGSVGTTFVFAIASVGLEFFIGMLLALSVESFTKGRNALRTILLIPWTLPTAVIAVLWAWILNDQYGVLNTVLLRLGFIGSSIA